MGIVSIIGVMILCAFTLTCAAGLICLLALYTDKIWIVMAALVASYIATYFVVSFMFAMLTELAKGLPWLIPS